MKKVSILLAGVFLLGLIFQSCNNQKTYAEMKKEEREAIQRFIEKEGINVISFEQFQEQDSTTDVNKNQFVLFADNGVYMQIVEKGNGEKMKDGSHELLIRYVEEQIEEGGTTDSIPLSSNTLATHPDEMRVTKSGKNYQATFKTGIMAYYYSSAVPSGWLIPFNYIKIGREISDRSKVRLIVPHSQGQVDASAKVYPCYYEITYQLTR